MRQPKPLKDLTLLDRFLFSAAMDDPQFAEDVFSIIMGEDIILKHLPQSEKEQRNASLRKLVRLDVWAMDEQDAVFDAEVQRKNTQNLPKRSRYYQALIDSNLMSLGDTDYNHLNRVHIIIITPFDLFGENRYCYTFRMGCVEVPGIELQDGASRIFLNTKGTNDDSIDTELRSMLRFFEEPTEETAVQSGSDRIKRMQQHVESLKFSEELGVKYMQEWEEKLFAQQEARATGLAEGRAEGRAVGRVEGRAEGRAEGVDRVNRLNQLLIEAGRMEDLTKSAKDTVFQNELFIEFDL